MDTSRMFSFLRGDRSKGRPDETGPADGREHTPEAADASPSARAELDALFSIDGGAQEAPQQVPQQVPPPERDAEAAATGDEGGGVRIHDLTALLGLQGAGPADEPPPDAARKTVGRKASRRVLGPAGRPEEGSARPGGTRQPEAPRQPEDDRASAPSYRLDWLVDFIGAEEAEAAKGAGAEAQDTSRPSAPADPGHVSVLPHDLRPSHVVFQDTSEASAPSSRHVSGLESEAAQAPHSVTPKDLERVVRTEGPPADGAAAFRTQIEAAQEDILGGDGHLEELEGSTADGHQLDLAGKTPVADVLNWVRTGQAASAPGAANEAAGAPDDEAAALDAITAADRVVAFLLRDGTVTPEQVLAAQRHREKTDADDALWRVLAQGTGVDREAVFAGAARVYAFPFVDLDRHEPNVDFTRSVMESFPEEKRDRLLSLGVVPFRAVREPRREALRLIFITHDPTRPAVHRAMQQLPLQHFDVRYAPESAVASLLTEAFPKKNKYLERMEGEGMTLDLGTNYQEEDSLVDEEALEAEISRSKLINLFEAALLEAVRQGASDLHIYPNADKKVEIHFRVDGRLKHWHTEDKVHPEALLAVIKDNSTNVDRFERDAAQDGFIQRWVDETLIRFRVSVLPIANASQEIRSESIVIRVLDDRKIITDLSQLGLLKGALDKFEHAIRQPHGMVILTGPTGSGKSTTLVAALHSAISPEVNVLTVEDPVEYIIPGVRQIKLNHKLSLDQALRAILRHDPDVVMVGEMRDRQTAELAIKLANTGHLTFSTLHTNDAPSAISRLYKMGVEPFLIAYAINLVVAQRLIRKLCPACKRIDSDPDPVLLQRLGFTEEEIQTMPFYMPGQDRHCKTCKGFGYKGRRAVSEALYFSREVRHMIVEADRMIDEDAIRDQARSEGMLTLQDSAREVVKMGETSIREMIRVVTSEAH